MCYVIVILLVQLFSVSSDLAAFMFLVAIVGMSVRMSAVCVIGNGQWKVYT